MTRLLYCVEASGCAEACQRCVKTLFSDLAELDLLSTECRKPRFRRGCRGCLGTERTR